MDAIRIDSAEMAPAEVVAVMLGHIERLSEN